jgi:hypothetical protein
MKPRRTCRNVTEKVYEKGINISMLGNVLIIGAFIIFLTGCGMGMGGDHDGSSGSTGFMNEGHFMDSPVQGLRYESETQSGTTGTDGRFYYKDGEMVTFKMGQMILGTVRGAAIVTPIDIVPGAIDETNSTVTNMLRFLQSMDEDNNPDNGITLPIYMMDELEGRGFHFYMGIDEFENDPSVLMFMDDMRNMHEEYANRMMVSVNDAQAHMRNTMMSMMGGNYDPNNMLGTFIDSPVQGLHYETDTHSGTTDENGRFYYARGELVMFSMGGIYLGQAQGNTFVTPIDMVPGANNETHPTVTNMLRFLQTMDEDNDPTNGIILPTYMIDELEGRGIHFDMASEDFEHVSNVQMFMDTMSNMYEPYADRMMVSSGEAQGHMRESMINMQPINNGGDSYMGDNHMNDDQSNGGMTDDPGANGDMVNGDIGNNDGSHGGGGGMMM